jgi:hypothetical protein
LNPVSGLGLKQSARGGTIPDMTGQPAGGDSLSVNLSEPISLFVATLTMRTFLDVAPAGYDDLTMDKRELAILSDRMITPSNS